MHPLFCKHKKMLKFWDTWLGRHGQMRSPSWYVFAQSQKRKYKVTVLCLFKAK